MGGRSRPWSLSKGTALHGNGRPALSVRPAVLVGEPALFVGDLQVDVRIVDETARPPHADLQQHRLAVGAVLEMVRVGVARLEAGAVARAEQLLARVGD